MAQDRQGGKATSQKALLPCKEPINSDLILWLE